MKDIFVDADSATNFSRPTNNAFKKFVEWLFEFDINDKNNCAHLMISPKLLTDYFRGCRDTSCKNSIASIYTRLDSEDRINRKSTPELQKFMNNHFTEKIWKDLRCKKSGSNDPFHIALIYLSNRKLALTNDGNLKHDLETIRLKKNKDVIIVSSDPDQLAYR